MEALRKKYPYADLSRFIEDDVVKGGRACRGVFFGPDKDDDYIYIEDLEFKENKHYTKYLTSNKRHPFPKMWLSGGVSEKLPLRKFHHEYHGKYNFGTKATFPEDMALDYPPHNLKVYINGYEYYMSMLPILEDLIDTDDDVAKRWDNAKPYYRVIFVVFCATYCSGVSIEHLTPSLSVYLVITSVMRFHLYFTVRRLIRRIEAAEKMADIGREFGSQDLYDKIAKIPRAYKKVPYLKKNPDNDDTGHLHRYENRLLAGYKTDYRRYAPRKSSGFTPIGLEHINQSIEAFVYSALGAQARTKQSIYGDRASALESQKVFRQLVEDGVVNYDNST